MEPESVKFLTSRGICHADAPAVVQVWFQNRRARTKIKNNIADFDSLKGERLRPGRTRCPSLLGRPDDPFPRLRSSRRRRAPPLSPPYSSPPPPLAPPGASSRRLTIAVRRPQTPAAAENTRLRLEVEALRHRAEAAENALRLAVARPPGRLPCRTPWFSPPRRPRTHPPLLRPLFLL